MSRYDFPGKAGASRVSIGWDRPLQTFFVQAFGPDPERPDDEVALAWEGTGIGDLPTAASAIRIAAIYADLPADIGKTLETDRLRTVATPGGPAQYAIKRLFPGS